MLNPYVFRRFQCCLHLLYFKLSESVDLHHLSAAGMNYILVTGYVYSV